MYRRHNKYEWKPVERKKLFTNSENVDTNTLLQIDDYDILLSTCLLNKYTQSLCNNYFWECKIRQLLPGFEFPIEYNNKGRKLYLIISNIDTIFERKELTNFESRYYQQWSYDNNLDISYYDLNCNEISITNWSIKNNKPGLLKTMLRLGFHPDHNYINEAYNNYDIIKTLVDYINKNPDIENVYALLPNGDSVLSLPNIDAPGILELLLPFNIIDIKELLINIFILADTKSLQMIINKEKYFTEEFIELGYIYDRKDYPITKILIDNNLFPTSEILNELPKEQKSYIQKYMK